MIFLQFFFQLVVRFGIQIFLLIFCLWTFGSEMVAVVVVVVVVVVVAVDGLIVIVVVVINIVVPIVVDVDLMSLLSFLLLQLV